jgi:hypothetical protein
VLAPAVAAAAAGQKLLPAQLASDDSFPAPALVTSVVLSAALITDADAFHRPLAGPLAPSRITDAESIFTPAVTHAKLPKEQRLRPDRIDALETFFAFTKSTGPVTMAPSVVANDDAIAAADTGRQVIATFTEDADAVYGVGVTFYNELLPDTYGDEEATDRYAFRVQSVSGGIPVPKPPHLTGSIAQRRVLTGSIAGRRKLTGSLRHNKRVLKGSLRSVHYGNKKR